MASQDPRSKKKSLRSAGDSKYSLASMSVATMPGSSTAVTWLLTVTRPRPCRKGKGQLLTLTVIVTLTLTLTLPLTLNPQP